MDPHPQIKKLAVFKKIANFVGKLLQHYKQLECEIFRLLLKHVSDHLSVLFQFAWLDIFFFFFYLGFLSQTFTNHRTAREGGVYFFNSSLKLPPASQTLRHWLSDYCREPTSPHSQQPDSNREPLVSERKSLTTKLRWSGHSFVIKFLKV